MSQDHMQYDPYRLNAMLMFRGRNHTVDSNLHKITNGSTCIGKSSTVFQILSQLSGENMKFLLVTPVNGECRNLVGINRDVAVYGTNPEHGKLLRINPFSFPPEMHICGHLDHLMDVFRDCLPMCATMPAIIREAVTRAYEEAGWDFQSSRNRHATPLYPDFADVLHQLDAVMEQLPYSGDIRETYQRVISSGYRSLAQGINERIFTSAELTPPELFDQNVIVDLSQLDSDETKPLILGLLVMKLKEYRMSSSAVTHAGSRHVVVLDEAHRLLNPIPTGLPSEPDNCSGMYIEMLTRSFAEMRIYSESLILGAASAEHLCTSFIPNATLLCDP